MEEKQHIIRKKWVKRFAIIFFAVLLVLTFFSNTIMNYSLPEVATQSIEADTVSSKVRGSGTVEAGVIKEISISESREVDEVLVKEGDTVKKDDILVKLKDAESEEIVSAQKELDGLKNSYKNSILVNEIEQTLVDIAESGKDTYNEDRNKLISLSENVKNAQSKVDSIQDNINKLTANKDSDRINTDLKEEDTAELSEATDPELIRLNNDLESAQKELEKATEEHTKYLSRINTINELKSQYDTIKAAEENLEQLKLKAVGNEVKASADGVILNVDVKKGDTISPDISFISIQDSNKGYSLTISVTSEQAKKLKVGDEASIANSWYYDDITAKLSSIKSDPSMPGKQKLLILDITGNVEAGATLSVSIGEKSSTYDYVVPNSAIREDNNGKFILVVREKSSPLGNRYVAKRIDVEVLATDESKSAISGGIESGEYVITTSSKLIKSGDLIRLAD